MAIVECGIGCGLCIYVCPTSVIYSASVGDEFKDIYINEDGCICCGECVAECPIEALGIVLGGCGDMSGGGGGGGWIGGSGGGEEGGGITGGDSGDIGGSSGDWGNIPLRH